MTEPVFLVAELPEGVYELAGPEGRHAASVKRLRADETLILTDGAGQWAPATVIENRGRSLLLDVSAGRYSPQPAVRVTVVQALPKGERSELAVELATEAGVDAVIPWQAERCVARWTKDPSKAQRGADKWRRTAQEAAKQARRRWVPVVAPLASTDAVAERVAAADLALVLHEDRALPLSHVELPTAGSIVLIVGPEGGVSPHEIDRFTAAGAIPVRLGPEVLRTSTAAAVALAAVAIPTGRW